MAARLAVRGLSGAGVGVCVAAPRHAGIGATLLATAPTKSRMESVMSGLITASVPRVLDLLVQTTVLGAAALVGLGAAFVVNPLLPL